MRSVSPDRAARRMLGASTCVLLALSACVEPPERGGRAAPVELPERFLAGADAPSGESGTSDASLADDWWTDFAGPRGAELVAEALAANPDLRATAARLLSAEARARVTGADSLPQVDVSLSRDRSKRNLIGVPIPGAPSPLTVRSTQYDLAFGVSWEPDLWGRLASAEQAALADVQAAASDLASARMSLIVATLRGWVALLESRAQLALAEDTARNWADDEDFVRSRFAGGRADAASVELVSANAATARATLLVRRRQHEQAARVLELLLGRYPGAELEADAELPELAGDVPAGLPATLLARRPDLLAAERRLRAGELRRDASDAALYPSLKLTGSVGTSSEDLSDLLDGDFIVWRLLGQLVQPLWHGGRLRAAVEVADAEARALSEAFAGSLLDALAEVEGALSAESWLRDEELARRAAALAAGRAREQASRRWSSGSGDVLTLLEVERGEDAARSALLGVRRARLDARLDLVLALGGGFDASALVPEEGAEDSDTDTDTDTHDPSDMLAEEGNP